MDTLNNTNGTVDDNYDEDLSKIPYPRETRSLPAWEISVKVIIYSLIILLALVGNTLVVYVVWRMKKMRTTTNYYIVNLAISDLMVTITCSWVKLVDDLTENWELGAFFCKYNSFAQVLSFVSSILTLTLISCDRFFGIVFAMKARMTDRRSTLFIVLIWVCALGISSPLLFFRELSSRQWLDHLEIWCHDALPIDVSKQDSYKSLTKAYNTILSVVLYIVPILIMTIAYSFIIWRLWSSEMPGERIESEVRNQDKTKKKVKRKIVIMLVVILCVFAICWLPFHIALWFTAYRDHQAELPSWYSKFYFFATLLTCANSAFNPIIYTGFNDNFRKAFKSVFKVKPERNGFYNPISGALGNSHSTVVSQYNAHHGTVVSQYNVNHGTVVSQYNPHSRTVDTFHSTVVTKI